MPKRFPGKDVDSQEPCHDSPNKRCKTWKWKSSHGAFQTGSCCNAYFIWGPSQKKPGFRSWFFHLWTSCQCKKLLMIGISITNADDSTWIRDTIIPTTKGIWSQQEYVYFKKLYRWMFVWWFPEKFHLPLADAFSERSANSFRLYLQYVESVFHMPALLSFDKAGFIGFSSDCWCKWCRWRRALSVQSPTFLAKVFPKTGGQANPHHLSLFARVNVWKLHGWELLSFFPKTSIHLRL